MLTLVITIYAICLTFTSFDMTWFELQSMKLKFDMEQGKRKDISERSGGPGGVSGGVRRSHTLTHLGMHALFSRRRLHPDRCVVYSSLNEGIMADIVLSLIIDMLVQ